MSRKKIKKIVKVTQNCIPETKKTKMVNKIKSASNVTKTFIVDAFSKMTLSIKNKAAEIKENSNGLVEILFDFRRAEDLAIEIEKLTSQLEEISNKDDLKIVVAALRKEADLLEKLT